MNLIYPIKIENIYKIFRQNYNFDIKDCNIKLIDIKEFDKVRKILLIEEDLFFNWSYFNDYIDKCDKCYNICYKDINLFVIMVGKMDKKTKIHLCKSLYRAYLTAKLYDIKKSFNYYLILNPSKRKLPKKNIQIDVKNINGGFTYINGNDIYILRKEDYDKVMLHELIHHNDLINNTKWRMSNINKLKELCNIGKETILIPNEAIVETYACIINTIFYSIEYKKNFKLLLKDDRDHNLLLSHKILKKQGKNKWNENTHSYCYIILKTIFYIYFDNFLKIYKYNNDNEITEFIHKYFFKLKEKIRKKKYNIVNKSLKQTIYNTI